MSIIASRTLKIISALIAIPIVIFIIILVVLDNPDIYRDKLEETFKDETQLILEINGDVKWRYWPPIAIEINDVAISPENTTTSLARLNVAKIDIKVLPLITAGRIAIDGIHIDGFDINAVIGKSGKGNWETDTLSTDTSTQTSKQEESGQEASSAEEKKAQEEAQGSNFELDISDVSITNSTLVYRNLSDKSHYTLSLEYLKMKGLRADQLADLSIEMMAADEKEKISSKIKIDGGISINKTMDKFALDQFLIEALIKQKDQADIAPSLLLNGSIDTEKAIAELKESRFNLSELALSFSLNANQIFDNPAFEGNFSIPAFNANKLMLELGMALPPMHNPKAFSAIGLSADIQGTSNQITLSNFKSQIDSSKLTGKLAMTLSPAMAADFTLAMDQMIVSDYIPSDVIPTDVPGDNGASSSGNGSASKPTGSAATQGIADSEVIPLELLSEIQFTGSFDLAGASYDDYQLNDIKLKTNNKQGRLSAKLNATGYDGDMAMQLNLTNIKPGTNPKGNASVTIKGIDIAKVIETEALTGTLAMDSKHTFSGNMLSEVLASLDGNSKFNVTKGTLDVRPLKKVASDIDKVRGKTSSLSTWPDMRPFEHLQGNHQINQGISANQQFAFSLENMKVKGNGGLDYFGNNVDFNIEASMEENSKGQFPVGPHLANIAWPLRCKGSLDAEASDLCSPDSKGIRKILRDIAKKAIKKKAKGKIQEKLKAKLPDEDKDAAINKAKEDAKAKAKEKAKKLLKGLFN